NNPCHCQSFGAKPAAPDVSTTAARHACDAQAGTDASVAASHGPAAGARTTVIIGPATTSDIGIGLEASVGTRPLFGLSTEVKVGIEGRLNHDHQVWIESPSGDFFFCSTGIRDVRVASRSGTTSTDRQRIVVGSPSR